jgi:hypothetical protein
MLSLVHALNFSLQHTLSLLLLQSSPVVARLQCSTMETLLLLLTLLPAGYHLTTHPQLSTLNSELQPNNSHYDRRPVSQCVLVSSPVWSSWPDVNCCLTVTVLSINWLTLSELSLHNLGTDAIENTVSTNVSNYCLAMGWTLLRVYPADATQWTMIR